MKSLASLTLLAALQVPPAPPPGTPSGSSERAETAYDTVGRVALAEGEGMRVTAATGLPADSVVEVTALDTGKTIVALATDAAPPAGRAAALTTSAAGALGVADGGLVRIRRTVASAPELVALRAGQTAEPRADAPQALLVGLRRRAGPVAVPAPAPMSTPMAIPPARPGTTYAAPNPTWPVPTPASPPRTQPTPVERPRPQPTAVVKTERPRPAATPAAPRRAAPEPVGQKPRFYVQVAALSDPGRAQVLAYSLGGRVEGARPWRVRMGPYVTREAAESGRAVALRRGHRDARIFTLR